MRSRPETPLLFVAGGTGFAPILALLRQQIRSQPERDMVLIWGMKAAQDFYALDDVQHLLDQCPHLRVVLAAETDSPTLQPRDRLSLVAGNAIEALSTDMTMSAARDIYAAGPPAMLRLLGNQLDRWGIARDRVHIDSFGV
jgi:CDP-4-dehydro-6-deoxyglucose reductase